MIFSKIKYPFHQVKEISKIKETLDKVFYDCEEYHYNVLLGPEMADQVRETNLRQAYKVEDKFLRFDHTHVKMKYAQPEGNFKCFGPVFRKEPSKKGRYRQFYQYDLDYSFKIIISDLYLFFVDF